MGVFYIKPALVIEPAYMPAEPDGFNDGELEVLLLVGLVLLTVVGADIMFGGGAVFFAAASLSFGVPDPNISGTNAYPATA